eukprot:CAMPEP_0194301812 /NCGR_PEP_ID=MMETSP0169-20130528/61994_1 /TAXON_ID=218684 /ORGANISM="Corethron pennatum, Strain L29A3" /LENGTH=633 /DNA_ID=CAMNT_0039052085 /DNA_START=106 /DNA_END=2008 /DNA_ORIENTATION=-
MTNLNKLSRVSRLMEDLSNSQGCNDYSDFFCGLIIGNNDIHSECGSDVNSTEVRELCPKSCNACSDTPQSSAVPTEVPSISYTTTPIASSIPALTDAPVTLPLDTPSAPTRTGAFLMSPTATQFASTEETTVELPHDSPTIGFSDAVGNQTRGYIITGPKAELNNPPQIYLSGNYYDKDLSLGIYCLITFVAFLFTLGLGTLYIAIRRKYTNSSAIDEEFDLESQLSKIIATDSIYYTSSDSCEFDIDKDETASENSENGSFLKEDTETENTVKNHDEGEQIRNAIEVEFDEKGHCDKIMCKKIPKICSKNSIKDLTLSQNNENKIRNDPVFSGSAMQLSTSDVIHGGKYKDIEASCDYTYVQHGKSFFDDDRCGLGGYFDSQSIKIQVLDKTIKKKNTLQNRYYKQGNKLKEPRYSSESKEKKTRIVNGSSISESFWNDRFLRDPKNGTKKSQKTFSSTAILDERNNTLQNSGEVAAQDTLKLEAGDRNETERTCSSIWRNSSNSYKTSSETITLGDSHFTDTFTDTSSMTVSLEDLVLEVKDVIHENEPFTLDQDISRKNGYTEKSLKLRNLVKQQAAERMEKFEKKHSLSFYTNQVKKISHTSVSENRNDIDMSREEFIPDENALNHVKG